MKLLKYTLTLLACATAPVLAGDKKLNVLMIAVDDMRPELGCYGADHIISPNIDKLAKSGVLFKRAYCQQAICGPTRASLLTGLRPDTIGIHGNHAHYRDKMPDVVTLPQLFKNNGYFAAACGKINHGVFPKGMAPKWDVMGDKESWSVPAFRPGPRYYYTEEGIKAAKKIFKKRFPKRPIEEWDQFLTFGPLTEASPVADDVPYDGQVAKRAVEYLDEFGKKKDQPFFLAVGFIKPHSPYTAPKKYFDLYDPKKIALAKNPKFPKGAPSFAGHGSNEKRRYTDQRKKGAFSAKDQKLTKQAYFACISYIDAQIGTVLDALEKNGLAQNTIVILWSDHGYHLGEKGLWGKTTNYELDTNVAMIWRVPNMKGAGKQSQALVELVDVYPTLVDAAGFKKKDILEGSSVMPLFDDPNKEWKKAAFSQYSRGHRKGYAIKTDRYRFVEWLDLKNKNAVVERELYDHKTDPRETTNIAKDPAQAELVKKLSSQLGQGKGWKSVQMK